MAGKTEKPRKKQVKKPAPKAAAKSKNDQPGTPDAVPDYWLNKRQVCDSLGITATAFDKWKVEPVARRGNRAYYDLRTILDNRREALLAQQALQVPDDPDAPDPIREQAGLNREKRIAQALKNQVTRGELIPASVAGALFGRIAAEIGAVFDALPANIKRKVPSLTATDLEFIKQEAVRAQNAAAKVDRYLDELIDDIKPAADAGD